MNDINEFGQPIGPIVAGWSPPIRPPAMAMTGRWCTVAPFNLDRDLDGLWAAEQADGDGRRWTYLPHGPFDRFDDFQSWAEATCQGADPMFHTIRVNDQPVGFASYLRIDPANGSIEVGYINFSALLQRTVAATEAMYLMMARAFELGYRRYEWKCNALN